MLTNESVVFIRACRDGVYGSGKDFDAGTFPFDFAKAFAEATNMQDISEQAMESCCTGLIRSAGLYLAFLQSMPVFKGGAEE